MDLSTRYLGMTLRTPLVPSASPLSANLDNLKRMEDAGASAIVLHSLFEEQLKQDSLELQHHLHYGNDSFAEALTYVPAISDFKSGPDQYLDYISSAKSAVAIPVIASLNGASLSGWTSFAANIQQAGADAIELNIYSIPTDVTLAGVEVENECIEIVKAVRGCVALPLAVKVSPYFSNLAHVAAGLDRVGADGLVLFNRFYQADVDIDNLRMEVHVRLSKPQEMRLPLTWIGLLYGRIEASLAGTTGVHSARDVIKLVMAGADVTMLCSVLYERGFHAIGVIEHALRDWLAEHEYDSLESMKGSMSQLKCADPAAFERAQYVQAVGTFRPTPWPRLTR